MVFRVSNLLVVSLFVLLSGCYLSFDVSHSTGDDGGRPSVNSGSPSAVGGNSSVEIDKPLVDAGYEEASLLGAWQGRSIFANVKDETFVLDDWTFEFTRTEVLVFYRDIKLGEARYSINKNANPHQLDLVPVYAYFAGPSNLKEKNIESTNLRYTSSAIFKIEDGELTIATSAWPFVSTGSPPRSLEPRGDGTTLIFQLTSVR